MAKYNLTRLQAQAQVTNEWSKHFSERQCNLSDRFLRTLAQFGLHNMRGSDEATEMLVAGTIKALAEEVSLPLFNRALSLGCPSRHTLAQGDKRLAADVYTAVVK